jgi:phthiocerol/phenolphthiocerol synthesis type-I polyketide synthase E
LPKAVGAQCLEAAFAGQPRLDFAVSLGGTATPSGPAGGGDAAAAAFLAAATRTSRLAGGRPLSVTWPRPAPAGAPVADADSAPSGAAGHPEPVGGPQPVLVWERDLSAATDWALDEHRVGRTPLLPATAQLELIIDAYREVQGLPVGPLVLRDVVFQAALLVPRPRRLRLMFRPGAGQTHTVRVESRLASGEDGWTVHATAEVQAGAGAPGQVDLPALRQRFTVAGEAHSGRANASDLVLGPRWHNIAQSWALPGERLLRIELPAPYLSDLDSHRLHPALLDTTTAAVRGAGQAAALPFLYRQLVVYADLPARYYAHVRQAERAAADSPTGDIDVFTEEGRVVLAVEGFTMRAIGADTVAALVRPGQPAGPTAGAARSGTAAGAAPDGPTPAEAAEMLLRLLDAHLTGSVLVRPAATP